MVELDDALSFYKYLAISRRDREWGLFATGTGHEVMTRSTSPKSTAYRYELKSGGHDNIRVSFDPSYPQPYRYEWDQGRTFVDEYGLLYFNSGSSWLFESETASSAIEVPAGSAVFLFPGMWHRYRPLMDTGGDFWSTLWCTFGGGIARQWQRNGLISPAQPVVHVGSSPSLVSVFRRLHNCVRSNEAVGPQPTLSAGIVELLKNIDAARSRPEPSISADVIQQAKTMLEDIMVQNVAPKQISRILNIPYNHFRHSFKQATGMSPHQYQLQLLMRRAKELLETTEMPIKDVAFTVGFSDQYYFAKVFKMRAGMTPTQWRTQSRRRNTPSD
jgi:AraC-like DNA-binding protein